MRECATICELYNRVKIMLGSLEAKQICFANNARTIKFLMNDIIKIINVICMSSIKNDFA